MKKFWKYFTLTILLLLGLCCVGILYLFFVPNSSLFGICYISNNEHYTSQDYSKTNVETIILNSNNYDVKIVDTDSDNISIKVYSNTFGFVLTKNKAVSIIPKLNNGSLTFNITEPTGFAFNSSSYIELSIPDSKTFNLNLKNNKAETKLNSSKIKLNNLTYETNNGDFVIENVTISGDIKLNLNKATLEYSSSVNNNSNDVYLNLTTGKFDASSSTFNDVIIESNTRGVVLIKECANITQDTTSAGGRIEVDTAKFVNIKSSSTNVYINNITDGAIIDLTNGNISIKDLTDNSSLTTDSGNINIDKLNSYSNIKTNTGNVTISNAQEHIELQTNYGTINIHYSDDAINRFVSAILDDGKIIVSGLEKINLNINGNGRAELDMKDVKGLSSIVANSGAVYVKVNKNAKYKLATKSDGSVRVNLAQIAQYGGYTTKDLTTTYVNCTSSTFDSNVLEISTTTGNLTVLDSNFA